MLVSSGSDNCIKMWVFDSPDGTARLLRSREGHRAPPRSIRYYGNTTLATMGEGAGELKRGRFLDRPSLKLALPCGFLGRTLYFSVKPMIELIMYNSSI